MLAVSPRGSSAPQLCTNACKHLCKAWQREKRAHRFYMYRFLGFSGGEMSVAGRISLCPSQNAVPVTWKFKSPNIYCSLKRKPWADLPPPTLDSLQFAGASLVLGAIKCSQYPDVDPCDEQRESCPRQVLSHQTQSVIPWLCDSASPTPGTPDPLQPHPPSSTSPSLFFPFSTCHVWSLSYDHIPSLPPFPWVYITTACL